jgi:hypothetical protein
MAITVPRPQGQQVASQAAPNAQVNVQTNLEAFGGGDSLNQVYKAAGNVADQMFQQEKKKADDTKTQQAYAKLQELKNTLLYDPKSGAMTKKGEAAFGAPDEYGSQFDKAAEEIEKDLFNDDQRQMFQNMKMRERSELDGTLSKHVYGESEKFAEETMKSGILAAQNDGVLNHHIPGKIEESIKLQQNLVLSRAEGKPEDQVKMELATVASKTHLQVVNSLLANDNDMKASEYFKKYGDQLTSDDKAKLTAALQEGVIRGESQRTTEAIINKYPDDMKAALTAARDAAKDNPKLQDEIVKRVQSRFAENTTIRRYQQEEIGIKGANIIDQTGDYDKIPPNLITQLSENQRESLMDYAKKKKSGALATEWQDYYDLKTLATADKETFLQTDLMLYRNKLADSEFKSMVDLQTGLRKGDAKANKQLDGYRTDRQIVEGALAEAGLKLGKNASKEQIARVNQFHKEFDDRYAEFAKANGDKKPTNKDMQQIADELLQKKIVDKGFFGFFEKSKFEFEMDKKQGTQTAQTKIINGKKYVKVSGGWKKAEK